jgi:hypothetical protein
MEAQGYKMAPAQGIRKAFVSIFSLLDGQMSACFVVSRIEF